MHRRHLLQSLAGIAALTPVRARAATRTAREAANVSTQPAAPARVVPPVVARDGTRLFVRSLGTGHPIVFVAPWGLNADWWEYQTVALAGPDIRCVTFDRRGHGRSDEPGQGYDFATLAADIRAVVERLDLRDVLLVGHSMGSAEVVRFLARENAGGRVTRAVLIATTTPFLLKTADNPGGIDRAVFEPGREAFRQDRPQQIAQAAPAFFGAPANAVSQPVMDWWTRMMVDRCSMQVMLDLNREMTDTDFRPDLARINVPVTLIHGDKDVSTPIALTGRPTQALVKGSTLSIYEGAAHGLPYTHRARLNAELRSLATR